MRSTVELSRGGAALAAAVNPLRAVVLGDFCLDAYWHIDTAHVEVSLETGHPVSRVVEPRYSLGGAGNVVANLAALGVGKIRVLGVRGDDAFGAAMTAQLAALADVDMLVSLGPAWPTPTYVKSMRDGVEQPRFDIIGREPVPQTVIDTLRQALEAAGSWADVVLVNQQVDALLCDPRMIDAVNEFIARHPRLPVIVDARTIARRVQGGILKLNLAEARGLFATEDASIHTVLARVHASTTPSRHQIFVTLGEGGTASVSRDGVIVVPGLHVSGRTDTVGAGDTVLAAIGAGLGARRDPLEVARFANVAASVTVGEAGGTGTATPAEIASAYQAATYVYNVHRLDSSSTAEDPEWESIEDFSITGAVSHAVFDHDGTLSTVRAGWEAIMVPLMTDAIIGAGPVSADRRTRAEAACRALIARTTGAPTLVQMQGLADLVHEFGHVAERDIKTASEYKAAYTRALAVMVDSRLDRVRLGELDPSAFHIKGSVAFLDALRRLGVTLHLASGTDESDVIADATALGYAHVFGDRIRGAQPGTNTDAKRHVLANLAKTVGPDEQIVVLGDGPVEMQEARRVGALAIGVCSDETGRSGFNPAKRERLIRGGAQLLIGDYTHLDRLLALLGHPSTQPTPERSRS